MHELGIAQNIVEIAVNAARNAGAVRVTRIPREDWGVGFNRAGIPAIQF